MFLHDKGDREPYLRSLQERVTTLSREGRFSRKLQNLGKFLLSRAFHITEAQKCVLGVIIAFLITIIKSTWELEVVSTVL